MDTHTYTQVYTDTETYMMTHRSTKMHTHTHTHLRDLVRKLESLGDWKLGAEEGLPYLLAEVLCSSCASAQGRLLCAIPEVSPGLLEGPPGQRENPGVARWVCGVLLEVPTEGVEARQSLHRGLKMRHQGFRRPSE